LAYVSFAEITDPTRHREFNEYHQLDHRPENLALPGVMFGERWVRSPDCAAAGPAPHPDFDNVHYVTMYWLREPVEQSRKEWIDLGTRATQWGRRPDLGWTRRPLLGPFAPVKGYVNARVLVSAEALPFRPMRGVYVTANELQGSAAEIEDLCGWYNEVRVPDLLTCRGAAGAWTFVSETEFPTARTGQDAPPPSVRLHVFFLDEDPLDFVADIAAHDAQWRAEGRLRDTSVAERPLFAGPLRTITPWEWDWFDRVAAPAAVDRTNARGT
jgi:hypothetical protein